MKIKELALKTDLSISTIRYYEKVGLIQPEKNGYFKLYNNEIEEQLIAIKKLQSANISLKDIKKLFSLPDKDPSQLKEKELKQIQMILEETLLKISEQEKYLLQSRKMLENMKKKVDLYNEIS